jgi:hypothetical protein
MPLFTPWMNGSLEGFVGIDKLPQTTPLKMDQEPIEPTPR